MQEAHNTEGGHGDGGSAFPCQPQWWDPDEMAYKPGDWIPGMSLRDYFAAKAMVAIVTKGVHGTDEAALMAAVAKAAYATADAMLKERAK